MPRCKYRWSAMCMPVSLTVSLTLCRVWAALIFDILPITQNSPQIGLGGQAFRGKYRWSIILSSALCHHLLNANKFDCSDCSKSTGREHVQCESKKLPPPWIFVAIFPKQLVIFRPNFTCLLCVLICARFRVFINLPATLTKLCHIKRDHPVHIMCAKCPPSAETHAGIFWHFSQTARNF